ncbi:MAG: hypothetical protein MUP73_07120 [Dehalococcoidia bacterium]|nr:hypothetical protein [Dehalococcoidia bacterium]
MFSSIEARVLSPEEEFYESIIDNLMSLMGETIETGEVEAIVSIVDNLSALRDFMSGPQHNVSYSLTGRQSDAIDLDGRVAPWALNREFSSVPVVTNSLLTNH